MKLLLDMNLSPTWVLFFRGAGVEAIHWSCAGKADATDAEIFEFAAKNSLIVATNDLDFGTMLANTRESGPSVIQIRTQDVSPDGAGSLLLTAIVQFTKELEAGAIVTVLAKGSKARVLPLAKRQ